MRCSALLLALTALAASGAVAQPSGALPTPPSVAQASPVTAALRLDDAARAALASHPSLDAARAHVEAARARIELARVPNLPQATLDVSHSEQTSNFVARPGAIPRPTGDTASGFSLAPSPAVAPFWSATASGRWVAVDFGRTGIAIDAAERTAEATRADLQTARDQLLLQVTVAYVQALAAEAVLDALRTSRGQAARNREIARAKVAAELRPQLDLLQAESELASAEVAVLRAEEAVRSARVSLGVLMGAPRTPTAPLERPKWQAPELDLADLDTDDRLDALVAQAIATRPEYEALAERVTALEGEARAASQGALPSLYVAAQASLAGTELTALTYNYGVTGGVSVPLSNVWTQQPAAREARARIRLLQAQRDVQVLQLRAEIDGARSALLQARKRLPALLALRGFATTAREHAQRRYEAGTGTLTDLNVLETGLAQASIQETQADLDIAAAAARLLRAIGRPLLP